LTNDLREKRKEYAQAMLSFLPTTEWDSWHHFVTDDQSWFPLNSSPHRILALSRGDVITKSGLDIRAKN
jgi:hypothetical protein